MTGFVKTYPRALVRLLGWRIDGGGLWAVSYLDEDGALILMPNGIPHIEPQDTRDEALNQAARSVEMMRGTPGGFIPEPPNRPLGTGDVW